MQLETIRAQVNNAISHERQSHALDATLRQFAAARGNQLTGQQRGQIVEFVCQYVQHAPAIMELVADAAERDGVQNLVFPILEAAAQYFVAPFDFIPDHLGIAGLTDDAYLVHSLVQGVSDYCREHNGKALLPQGMDLTQANRDIRFLIGEPVATYLDAAIAGTLAQAQGLLLNLTQCGWQIPAATPDPIWGNASINDIVNAKLGAMGVV